tara:strand:- start:909 stop:1208 length:300 start_codon:yes stop_codon:yes gene_type:complete
MRFSTFKNISIALGMAVVLSLIVYLFSLIPTVKKAPPKKYAEGDRIVLVLGKVEAMIISTSWIHGKDGYKIRVLSKGMNGQVTVTEQEIREFEIKEKVR